MLNRNHNNNIIFTQQMKKFYFTFGQGHYDDNHKSLGNFYTVIEKPTEKEARIEMSALRGGRWSMCYETPGMMHKHNLEFIEFLKLTKQNGETR